MFQKGVVFGRSSLVGSRRDGALKRIGPVGNWFHSRQILLLKDVIILKGDHKWSFHCMSVYYANLNSLDANSFNFRYSSRFLPARRSKRLLHRGSCTSGSFPTAWVLLMESMCPWTLPQTLGPNTKAIKGSSALC